MCGTSQSPLSCTTNLRPHRHLQDPFQKLETQGWSRERRGRWSETLALPMKPPCFLSSLCSPPPPQERSIRLHAYRHIFTELFPWNFPSSDQGKQVPLAPSLQSLLSWQGDHSPFLSFVNCKEEHRVSSVEPTHPSKTLGGDRLALQLTALWETDVGATCTHLYSQVWGGKATYCSALTSSSPNVLEKSVPGCQVAVKPTSSRGFLSGKPRPVISEIYDNMWERILTSSPYGEYRI